MTGSNTNCEIMKKSRGRWKESLMENKEMGWGTETSGNDVEWQVMGISHSEYTKLLHEN